MQATIKVQGYQGEIALSITYHRLFATRDPPSYHQGCMEAPGCLYRVMNVVWNRTVPAFRQPFALIGQHHSAAA